MSLLQKETDLENAQTRPLNSDESSSGKHGAEYRVDARTKYTYLGVYFGLNLGLTLFNKAILGKVNDFRGDGGIDMGLISASLQFRFPWLLTTIHTSTAALGCAILLWRGHFHLTTLSSRENLILLGFSVLYTVNIAISNVSL